MNSNKIANKRLALQPQISTPTEPIRASPKIDQIFRDATIYDRSESRWIVRGISEVEGEKIINLQGFNGALVSITDSQLDNYTRFKSKYYFPSIINQQTDLDVWNAKKEHARLEGRKVKFRPQDHLAAIADSCQLSYINEKKS